MLKPGEPPRLPRWGQISWSADAPSLHLYGDNGADNAEEAGTMIVAFVERAASSGASEARVKVRPVGGSPDSTAADSVTIGGVDQVLGMGPAKRQDLCMLLERATPPSLDLTFEISQQG